MKANSRVNTASNKQENIANCLNT